MKTVIDYHGVTWTLYETAADFIAHAIAPGIGDVELTAEQAQEVANIVLTPTTVQDADTATTHAGLVRDPRTDFWEAVAQVLGDK